MSLRIGDKSAVTLFVRDAAKRSGVCSLQLIADVSEPEVQTVWYSPPTPVPPTWDGLGASGATAQQCWSPYIAIRPTAGRVH